MPITPTPVIPISVLQNTDRPYKVYTFKFTQTFTSNPTVVVHENTIGNIVWTRTSAGSYRGTLSGAFPQDKTYFYALDPTQIIDLYTQDFIVGLFVSDLSNNVTISVTNTGVGTDSALQDTLFEIRVYP
jgi:hypothetical protein